MIAVNTCVNADKTFKVRCPECRSRICDMLLDDKCNGYGNNKVKTDKYSKFQIAIKCRKCGQLVGIGLGS